MTDPMAPYANETPEQRAEHERQIAEQAALEAGEKNVPPPLAEVAPPPPEPPEGETTTRSRK